MFACIIFWLSIFFAVWLSDCLTVWLADGLTIFWLSGSNNFLIVWLSYCLNVWLSYFLTVWLSDCPTWLFYIFVSTPLDSPKSITYMIKRSMSWVLKTIFSVFLGSIFSVCFATPCQTADYSWSDKAPPKLRQLELNSFWQQNTNVLFLI